MKKISRRNFLLASGVVTIGAALAACGGSSSTSAAASSAPASSAAASDAPASAEGKVLNIWCWNDEFQSRFNDYYPEVKEIAADKSTTTLKDGTPCKVDHQRQREQQLPEQAGRSTAESGQRRRR